MRPKHISTLRTSCGLRLNLDSESQNSWERQKVLALLLQFRAWKY